MEVAGVGAVKVLNVWCGNGTVKVILASEKRTPVDESIVAACYEHITDQRAVGIDGGLTVVSAQEEAVDIKATVLLYPGVQIETVSELFLRKVEEYFQSIAFEENTIKINELRSHLMQTDGVSDYTQFTLNGASANITLTEEQVPAIGEVSFL